MNQKVDFAQWLQKEMDARGISQAELARRAMISRATISKTLKQKSFPSWDICLSFARGLDLPPEIVLRAAGMLPEAKPDSGRVGEMIVKYKIAELNDEQLEKVLEYIEFIQDRDDKEHQREFLERHTREGETPPEVIKK